MTDDSVRKNRESLRESYRPDKVRVLFVGESPPKSGEFFYGPRFSRLFRATRQAFTCAFDRTFHDEEEFLCAFKASGCFLEDLCQEPINEGFGRVKDPRRIRKREECVSRVSGRFEGTNPGAIVYVGVESSKQAKIAAKQAQLNPHDVCTVPFPAQSNQPRYVEELCAWLRSLRSSGLFLELP